MSEVWAAAAVAVVGAAATYGATKLAQGSSGGGGTAGAAAGLTAAQNKILEGIANYKIPPLQLPTTDYTATTIDPNAALVGTSHKIPTYTEGGKGRVPMYKLGPGGKVILGKDGKPTFDSPDGKPLYTDSKFVTYKTDGSGATRLDANGNKIIDVNATTKTLKDFTAPRVDKGNADIYGTKVKTVPYEDNTRAYTPTQATGDLVANTSNIKQATGDLTAVEAANREAVAPGSQANMNSATNAIGQYLEGVVPQDVQDQTQRIVADKVGGTFNAFAPDRGQIASNQFARNIGQTSEQLQQYGIGANAQQQQLAQALTYTPDQAINAALGLASAQSNANQLTKGIDENRYTANLTNSYLKAAPDPRAAGLLNDRINLTTLNNGQQLAAAQFNFGSRLSAAQLAQQNAIAQANYNLGVGQLSLGAESNAANMQLAQQQNNAALISGIASSAGNTLSNVYGAYTTSRNNSDQAAFNALGSNMGGKTTIG